MIKLESLSIMIQPDPDFFATLRALPLLVDLHLFFLSPGTAPVVAASLAAKPSFRSLEVTMATANAWDEAELAMVRSRRGRRCRLPLPSGGNEVCVVFFFAW